MSLSRDDLAFLDGLADAYDPETATFPGGPPTTRAATATTWGGPRQGRPPRMRRRRREHRGLRVGDPLGCPGVALARTALDASPGHELRGALHRPGLRWPGAHHDDRLLKLTQARNAEAKRHDAYRLGPSIFKSWVLIIQHRPGLAPRLI